MLLATRGHGLPAPKPAEPTPAERQAVWAGIFLFCAGSWYVAGTGVTALWGVLTG